ncbi:MAG: hypothetical protein H6849_00085 [Alphaproteobacteria bacterium]|nr:MAG: hypothetical protein H6849_00085 [Alphaproteobacteria bacterium]
MILYAKLIDSVFMFLIPLWVLGRSLVLKRPNLERLVFGLVIFYGISLLLDTAALHWGEETHLLGGVLWVNGGVLIFHMIMKLLFILTIIIFYHTENRRAPRSLVMTLLTVAFAGYYTIAMTDNLPIAGMAIALVSLCNYGLIVYGDDEKISFEAATKYFVQTGVALAIFLLGCAFLAYAQGNLSLLALMNITDTPPVGFLGMAFVFTALAFWIGLAPVHFWMLDVYEAASLPVVSLFAGVSKVAFLAFFVRVLDVCCGDMRLFGGSFVLVLALKSIVWGGLSALTQRKSMRFLASSSVTQLGFMMCTLVSVGKLSQAIHVQGAFFYVISYALTTGGVLIILAFLQRYKVSYALLSDLVGLSYSLPFLSFFMTVFLLSLAGFPPFIGFFAKIEALRVMLQLSSWGSLSVVYAGMLLSLGYYLVIIKKIYFESPTNNAGNWLNVQRVRSTSLLVVVMAIGLVVFGYLFLAEVVHRPFDLARLPKIP